jgi:hypothetical protein
MPSPNVPLAAESLAAVGGIFRAELLGPTEAHEAERLPRDWQERVAELLDGRRRPGRPPKTKQVDYLHTWDRLTAQTDDHTLIAGVGDELVGMAYLEQLQRARAYLKSVWAPLSISTLLGPKLLPPSLSEQQRGSDLYAAVNDPTTVLRDMSAGCLLPDQALAFRTVYPELAAMLSALVDAELLRRRARQKSYEVPYPAEKMLRVQRGMPAGQAMTPLPAQAQPQAPPKLDIKITRKPNDLRTKAQSLSASE